MELLRNHYGTTTALVSCRRLRSPYLLRRLVSNLVTFIFKKPTDVQAGLALPWRPVPRAVCALHHQLSLQCQRSHECEFVGGARLARRSRAAQRPLCALCNRRVARDTRIRLPNHCRSDAAAADAGGAAAERGYSKTANIRNSEAAAARGGARKHSGSGKREGGGTAARPLRGRKRSLHVPQRRARCRSCNMTAHKPALGVL